MSKDTGRGLWSLLLEWVMRVLRLSWLTGPIFDKELRVSSRRRRNYVLRFVYVFLFMVLLALFWTSYVSRGVSTAYQASRMAGIGQGLIILVVWFEFFALQAVAVVMLSTAISDEIYGRTLGVLMTTPVGSLQIVLGKLLSRLLQLLLLLAITLPLLAMVRVFGGVPWDYLVCSLGVILTTVLFLGSLSLFFSIFIRRAYAVIITTILAVGLLFGVLPLLATLLNHSVFKWSISANTLLYVNPYVLLVEATEQMAVGRSMRSVPWPVYCGVALAASAMLLLPTTALVRRAALRQAVGLAGLWLSGARSKPSGAHRVRRVVGPPVLWKERRTPLLGRRKLATFIALLVALGSIGLSYALCIREDVLTDTEVHVGYAVVFLCVGILFTAVLPATGITSEKEAQTWPLLLTTSLSTWEILWGKLVGSLRRCVPAWLFLFGHVGLFAMGGIIHPLGIVHLMILVASIAFFLSAAGLYFSTRFRHTTTAVIANMALAVGVWALFPLLMGIGLAATHGSGDLLGLYMDANPIVQAVVITAATARNGSLAAYNWIEVGRADALEATGWILLSFAIYALAGLAFLALAGARLRRNPV